MYFRVWPLSKATPRSLLPAPRAGQQQRPRQLPPSARCGWPSATFTSSSTEQDTHVLQLASAFEGLFTGQMKKPITNVHPRFRAAHRPPRQGCGCFREAQPPTSVCGLQSAAALPPLSISYGIILMHFILPTRKRQSFPRGSGLGTALLSPLENDSTFLC